MVALWRRAGARQEKVLPVLDQDRLTVRRRLHHGAAGIAIAILTVAAPDEAGRAARGVEVDLERADAPRPPFRIAQSMRVRLWRRAGSREAMLEFDDFARVAGERRLEGHQAVAMRHVVLQVAGVERLHPEESGRGARPPLGRAWTGRDAVDRHLSASGWLATLCSTLPERSQISISLGKSRKSGGTRRAMDRAHQQMFAVGRNVDATRESPACRRAWPCRLRGRPRRAATWRSIPRRLRRAPIGACLRASLRASRRQGFPGHSARRATPARRAPDRAPS